MADDFPGIREYMRSPEIVTALAGVEKPRLDALMAEESPWAEPSPLEQIAKQLRIANLIQWASVTNNPKKYAQEIDEGLRP